MKTVFFLIGPPKTGTTSLQSWLMANSSKEFHYGGCRQPRNEFKNGDLSFEILKLSCQNEIVWSDIEKIQSKIDKLFNETDAIIFSEEMFLHTPKWKLKVKNLKIILFKYNLKISICHRDVCRSIPSYYIESFKNLPKKYSTTYLNFVTSSWVEMYDFEILHDYLVKNGYAKNDISYFLFNDLVDGQLTLNRIFNINLAYINWNQKIELAHQNKKSIEQSILEKNQFLVSIDPLNKKNKLIRKIIKKLDRTFPRIGIRRMSGISVYTKIITIPISPVVAELALKNKRFDDTFLNG